MIERSTTSGAKSLKRPARPSEPPSPRLRRRTNNSSWGDTCSRETPSTKWSRSRHQERSSWITGDHSTSWYWSIWSYWRRRVSWSDPQERVGSLRTAYLILQPRWHWLTDAGQESVAKLEKLLYSLQGRRSPESSRVQDDSQRNHLVSRNPLRLIPIDDNPEVPAELEHCPQSKENLLTWGSLKQPVVQGATKSYPHPV